jgi:ATP-dependent Lon protease
VLKSLRLVLVDHVDDVLREALVLPDPESIFGPARVLEYRGGELVQPGGSGGPPPIAPPAGPAEQPGA